MGNDRKQNFLSPTAKKNTTNDKDDTVRLNTTLFPFPIRVGFVLCWLSLFAPLLVNSCSYVQCHEKNETVWRHMRSDDFQRHYTVSEESLLCFRKGASATKIRLSLAFISGFLLQGGSKSWFSVSGLSRVLLLCLFTSGPNSLCFGLNECAVRSLSEEGRIEEAEPLIESMQEMGFHKTQTHYLQLLDGYGKVQNSTSI